MEQPAGGTRQPAFELSAEETVRFREMASKPSDPDAVDVNLSRAKARLAEKRLAKELKAALA